MSRRRDAGGTWPRPPWPSPDPTLRVGDAERNEVAHALSQHYSEGRIDDAELKERLDRAMGAKTGADLAGLMTDLPPLGGAVPAPPPLRRRHTGVWVAVIAVLVAMSIPRLFFWPFGSWWPHFPWILFAVVAFVLWRRSRRRGWRREPA